MHPYTDILTDIGHLFIVMQQIFYQQFHNHINKMLPQFNIVAAQDVLNVSLSVLLEHV